MPDTNKIRYGIKNVYYAVATIASDGSATYGTPVAMPGARSVSLSGNGENTKWYADNIVYYVSITNNGYEGDLVLAKVPDSFLKDCLGYIEDSNGVLVEDAGASPSHFALLFQFEGDAHAKRHVIYNCVASRPDLASTTKDEAVEPNEETISVTATTIYNTAINKDVVKASCTPNEATPYDSWFTAVYQSTVLPEENANEGE